MITITRFALILTCVAVLNAGCNRTPAPDDPPTADPHAGHDHEADGPAAIEPVLPTVPEDDPHAGHDHEADEPHMPEVDIDPHAGHDHEADEPHMPEVDIDPHAGHDHEAEASDEHGPQIATAGPGTIAITAEFPGEIILDPARTAHIVPRAAGIVREVNASLGDQVQAGELLAWIESDELAEAKLAFYAKHAQVGCCQLELPRAKEIYENTHRLLALLEQEPTQEDLRAVQGLEMGEYRGQLLTAYAEYLATRSAAQREAGLFEKNATSESELIEAESAFKKAHAQYEAARDIARYQVLIAYTETAQKRQVAEFEAVAAEQRLRLKGVDDDVLTRLLALVPKTAGLEPCLCDDPNCTEGELPSVLDTLGEEVRLGWYALRAPFAGYIIEKHITLGEKVGGEESVMTIADTSSVWVRLNVYQKDLATIHVGQHALIDLGTGVPDARGTITYLAPIIDRDTRTAQARVELNNPDGQLRPGLYASVHVDVELIEASVVVHRDAVQVIDDEEVIFIDDGDDYEPVPVQLGRADHDRVIVLSGLKPGQRYVQHGAFELKAQIVTSGLDPHAGHGH